MSNRQALLLCAWFSVVQLLLPEIVVAEVWDPFSSAPAASEDAPLQAAFGGIIYSRWNSDLKNDNNGEQLHEWRNKALLSVGLDGSRNEYQWKLHLSGLAAYDIFPTQSDLTAEFEPELWEAYAVWESSDWELSAGQQVRRWGRGIPSLFDVSNPLDLREFIFVEDEFQKIPIPMVRWTRYTDSYELELMAVPFYRAARQAENNSDWSPVVIRDLQGAEEIPLVEDAVDQGISPGIVTTPTDNLLNGDLGLRWTKYAQGWDLDLFVYWGLEDAPLPEFTPDFITFLRAEQGRGRSPVETLRSLAFQEIAAFSPIFMQRPKRQLLLGGSFVVPLEKVTSRFEIVGLSQQSVYTETLEYLRVPSLQGLVGFDALSGDRFLWSLSFAGNVLVTDESLFLINAWNVSTIGLMRVRPFDFDLWLEARSIWNINLGDAWLGPSLLYDVFSGFQVQAGVNLLEGTLQNPLGQLDENDYFWARLKYVF